MPYKAVHEALYTLYDHNREAYEKGLAQADCTPYECTPKRELDQCLEYILCQRLGLMFPLCSIFGQ